MVSTMTAVVTVWATAAEEADKNVKCVLITVVICTKLWLVLHMKETAMITPPKIISCNSYISVHVLVEDYTTEKHHLNRTALKAPWKESG